MQLGAPRDTLGGVGRWPILLLLASCAAAAHPPAKSDAGPAPEVELAKPFAVPGEAMEYAASLRGLDVGRAVTAVGKLGYADGHRSVIIKTRGQSTGMIALLAELTWEETSTVDVDRGHVLASHEESWDVIAGGHEEHDVFTIGDEGSHDLHSAVAAVRAWRSMPGQHAKLTVRFAGGSFPTELADMGHGYLVSAQQPAVRYEGTFDHAVKFAAWVSDDIARVPLRFECDFELIGLLVVELVHYTPPAE